MVNPFWGNFENQSFKWGFKLRENILSFQFNSDGQIKLSVILFPLMESHYLNC